MATLSRAVATPFSLVVSPVEVISTGSCSEAVLLAAIATPAAKNIKKNPQTSVRMADAEGTACGHGCKGKSRSEAICFRSITPRELGLVIKFGVAVRRPVDLVHSLERSLSRAMSRLTLES